MDPIADFLTKIRNALMRRKPAVVDRYSNMKLAIAKILRDEGFIESVKKTKDEAGRDILELELRYDEEGNPMIHSLRRISKPGRRIYVKYRQIPRVKPLAGHKEELGIVIISTSRGVMTGEEARKRHLGGELIAEIY
ncbi:30S ribosomal protein S8 [bacterium]|nr:30S ribosomal protein S8 [bacterium]